MLGPFQRQDRYLLLLDESVHFLVAGLCRWLGYGLSLSLRVLCSRALGLRRYLVFLLGRELAANVPAASLSVLVR